MGGGNPRNGGTKEAAEVGERIKDHAGQRGRGGQVRNISGVREKTVLHDVSLFAKPGQKIAFVGATGAGKSYIANALGIAACRKLYKVRYVSLPDLLNEFAVAKALNTQNKVKKAYAKFDLLIIDEWLLRPLSESESYDLLELIEACSRKGAMIFCTQYDTDEWYFRIDCDRPEGDDSAVAEAILDRIVHNKYAIDVKGRISMRTRHAFAETESGVGNNE